MQVMRFAEGYAPPSRLRPANLGLTVLTTGLVVSGLFFLNPKVIRKFEPILVVDSIPLHQPPPPPETTPKRPKTATQLTSRTESPNNVTLVALPDPPPLTFTGTPPVDFPPPGGDVRTIEPTKPMPVISLAEVDSRFANLFQPTYPTDEIRMGRTGRVTVKVLIGTDGRVKDVEKVSAPSDSFWDATRRQALAKWRFRPATRDGVPYETWKVMNVSFVLNQEE